METDTIGDITDITPEKIEEYYEISDIGF